MAEIQRIIRHFSHEHPLELTKLQQQSTTPSSAVCAGCKFKASGVVYACKTCNYILHITCSKPPQKIIHPSHPNHPLILFPAPVYPEGVFACNACGREGSGFCYHCKECELDIDIFCASMNPSVAHGSHPHPLTLVFSPPYATKNFVCDICKKQSTDQWLYRCDACSFDAHMSCGMSKRSAAVINSSPRPQLNLQQVLSPRKNREFFPGTGSSPRPQLNLQQVLSPRKNREFVPGIGSSPLELGSSFRAVPHLGAGASAATLAMPYAVEYSGRTNGENLMGHLVQGFVEGCGQQVGQSVVQGILGGGNDPVSSLSAGVVSSVISSVIGLN